MTNWTLMHKNIPVALLGMEGEELLSGILFQSTRRHLPLSIQKVFLDIRGLCSEVTKDYLKLNDEGLIWLDIWLSNREIPVTRENFDAYTSQKRTPRSLLFRNNGLSFTDCYFLRKEGEILTWEMAISRLYSELTEYYQVKNQDGKYGRHQSTLGGALEKFWFLENGTLMLCKKTSIQNNILMVRELLTSEIYEQQGVIHTQYKPVYNTRNQLIGCKCPAFTAKDLEFVNAEEVLEEFRESQRDDCYEKLIERASNYGIHKKRVQFLLDIQIMVDFLITNRDRHYGNIGFLRNPDTLTFTKVAPVYDSGSSAILEGVTPENEELTTVNSFYNTALECLSHVVYRNALDLKKLPSLQEVKSFYQMSSLSKERIEELLYLFRRKRDFLEEFQQGKLLTGEDVTRITFQEKDILVRKEFVENGLKVEHSFEKF